MGNCWLEDCNHPAVVAILSNDDNHKKYVQTKTWYEAQDACNNDTHIYLVDIYFLFNIIIQIMHMTCCTLEKRDVV